MAAVAKNLKLIYGLLAYMVMVMVVSAVHVEAAKVTCEFGGKKLEPCLSFLTSGGKSPPSKPCCAGIKSLKAAATTKADRQVICKCLKDTVAALDLSPATLALAASLPAKCGVSLPFKFTPALDCSKWT